MRPPVHVYLRGKTVLLTGGTGFLGKVIVERLLRCAPEIGRIYLLIRTRSEPDAVPISAARRFETEVLTSGAIGFEVARSTQREPTGGCHRQPTRGVHVDARAGHAAVLGLVVADHQHGIVHA